MPYLRQEFQLTVWCQAYHFLLGPAEEEHDETQVIPTFHNKHPIHYYICYISVCSSLLVTFYLRNGPLDT